MASTLPSRGSSTAGERGSNSGRAGWQYPHRLLLTRVGVLCGCSVALGMMGQWASANHPEEDLWHLMTDCFPAPGVVGLASLQGLCRSGLLTRFEDSGVDPDPGDSLSLSEQLDVCDQNGFEGVVTATGNCAEVTYSGSPSCGPDPHVLCTANAGVSTNGNNFWHTFGARERGRSNP